MSLDDNQEKITHERWALLQEIDSLTAKPLLVLSFIWIGFIVIEFIVGYNPALNAISSFIWGLFILDFFIEIIIAPDKVSYLKRSWIVAISMFLPAFRILVAFRAFRALRLIRYARSVNLLKLITSTRRSARALANILSRHGFGYVVIVTIFVIFAGAAGMLYFENPDTLAEAGYPDVAGIASYGDALWWTAMVMTTMGSGYWPQTVEGRILGWLLSLYAFTFFGYITSTIASYFISKK